MHLNTQLWQCSIKYQPKYMSPAPTAIIHPQTGITTAIIIPAPTEVTIKPSVFFSIFFLKLFDITSTSFSNSLTLYAESLKKFTH